MVKKVFSNFGFSFKKGPSIYVYPTRFIQFFRIICPIAFQESIFTIELNK